MTSLITLFKLDILIIYYALLHHASSPGPEIRQYSSGMLKVVKSSVDQSLDTTIGWLRYASHRMECKFFQDLTTVLRAYGMQLLVILSFLHLSVTLVGSALFASSLTEEALPLGPETGQLEYGYRAIFQMILIGNWDTTTGWPARTANWWCGYPRTFVDTFVGPGILVYLIVPSILNFISVPNEILVTIFQFILTSSFSHNITPLSSISFSSTALSNLTVFRILYIYDGDD